MSSSWQLTKFSRRPKKFKKNRRIVLRKNPQKRAELMKNIITVTPRKPNSARRKVAWCKIRWRIKSKFQEPKLKGFFAYLNGDSKKFANFYKRQSSEKTLIGPQGLQKASRVLIIGGRTQDLPGLKYKIMRHHTDKMSNLAPLAYMQKRWSKYVIKKNMRSTLKLEKKRNREKAHRKFRYY